MTKTCKKIPTQYSPLRLVIICRFASQAVTEIQAALRAHRMRRQRLEKLNEEIEVEDEDSSVVTIQSAFRGHLARRRMQDEEPGDEWSRDHDARSRDSRM